MDAVDLLGEELVVLLPAGGRLKHGLLHLHGVLDEAAHPLVLEGVRVLDGVDGLHTGRQGRREHEYLADSTTQ